MYVVDIYKMYLRWRKTDLNSINRLFFRLKFRLNSSRILQSSTLPTIKVYICQQTIYYHNEEFFKNSDKNSDQKSCWLWLFTPLWNSSRKSCWLWLWTPLWLFSSFRDAFAKDPELSNLLLDDFFHDISSWSEILQNFDQNSDQKSS